MSCVLIYSPHEDIRDAIKAALCTHMTLIVTEDRRQCLESVSQKAPIHIAFIDVCSEENEADLEIFEEITAFRPGLKMIAVSDHDAEKIAVKAVKHGAAGYMIMPAKADDILTAAR